jgi:hypothetical protein
VTSTGARSFASSSTIRRNRGRIHHAGLGGPGGIELDERAIEQHVREVIRPGRGRRQRELADRRRVQPRHRRARIAPDQRQDLVGLARRRDPPRPRRRARFERVRRQRVEVERARSGLGLRTRGAGRALQRAGADEHELPAVEKPVLVVVDLVQQVVRAVDLDVQEVGQRAERRARGLGASGLAAQQAHGVDPEPRQHLIRRERARPRCHRRAGGVDHPVTEPQQRRARRRVAEQIEGLRRDGPGLVRRREQSSEQRVELGAATDPHARRDAPGDPVELVVGLGRDHREVR